MTAPLIDFTAHTLDKLQHAAEDAFTNGDIPGFLGLLEQIAIKSEHAAQHWRVAVETASIVRGVRG